MLKEREAAVLLASFSLIKIDEIGRCVSIHPSVHVWARVVFSYKNWWNRALHVNTFISACVGQRPALGRAAKGVSGSQVVLPLLLPFLNNTVGQTTALGGFCCKSCINPCKDSEFLIGSLEMSRVNMAARFTLAFTNRSLLAARGNRNTRKSVGSKPEDAKAANILTLLVQCTTLPLERSQERGLDIFPYLR